MKRPLFIVFIFGFSSGLPFALLSSTLQAWFADTGLSIKATGALSLLGLPYVYRSLWGPLLDRYALFSLGKRRSWILCMHIFLLLGFNILAWLSPQSSPQWMVGMAVLLACFSATLDVAIDAHRTEYLPVSLHGIGASVAVFAYRLALLLGGGVALLLAARWGWAFCYRVMGALMCFGIFATIYSAEPSISEEKLKALSMKDAFVEPFKEFLARPGIIALFCFIFLYKLGEAFTTTSSGIVMPFLIQGLGFSLESIAYVNKVMGVIAIVVGGLVAGFVLMRCSLYKALLGFGLLQAITNLFFIILAYSGKNIMLLALAVVSDNFAAGMGSTALVALFMRLVDKRFTGTQFSLLVAFSTLPRVLSGPIAAQLQAWVGWVGLYQLAFVLALAFVPFLFLIREQIAKKPESPLERSMVSIPQ
jgi:PAT family beta-lactamase induction signal transducer AmpG